MDTNEKDKKNKVISNPLTMIGVFAGIAEIAGTIVLPLIEESLQKIFIWYVMMFPVMLVSLFFYVLIRHHKNLYAPSDFKEEKHFMDLLRLEKEIGLSHKEITNKITQEVNSDKEILGTKDDNRIYSIYANIEKEVANKIREDFKETHDVVHGAKINNIEYDIVAKGKGFFDKDYIFEIKYVTRCFGEKWIENVINIVKNQATNYADATNRLPYKIIIFVTEKESHDEVQHMVNTQSKINNLRFDVVQKDAISLYKFSK